MGTTEESIVYQLLNSIRASELSNDETITERRIRSFLRTHRTQEIFKMSRGGLLAEDEFFQDVELTLNQINTYEWVGAVPDIVQLPNNFGIKFTTKGFTNIPVISEEYYHLSKKNIVNKFLPCAKVEGLELTLYIPTVSPYSMNNASIAESLYMCMKRNAEYFKLKVILDNPDDGIDYDWTTSPYPVPNQIIQTIKEGILRKEFSIILDTKSDQVPNMKNDTLRYHDQGKVQQ
jgi:hypothetical protein